MPYPEEWAKLTPERKYEIGQRAKARQALWVASNHDKVIAAKRKYKAKFKRPPKTQLCKEAEALGLVPRFTRAVIWQWNKKFGMSPLRVWEALERQNWCCAICHKPFEKTPRLDHDHETGKVRGFLCGKCNSGIGMLGDSILHVESALVYLRAHS